MNWISKKVGAVAVAASVAGLLCAADTSAQTNRRPRTSTPIPAPTQVPNEPLVISRADEFPDEGQTTMSVEPAPVLTDQGQVQRQAIDELGNRVRELESANRNKPDQDAKHKRLLLNLDILTRSEQRAETLRKQYFDMLEKESGIIAKIEEVENSLRPESVDRQIAFAGSLRPEELREARRRSLQAEKTNLQSLLTEVQKTKANLDLSLQKADALVERLRDRLEKEIDTALTDPPATDQ